MPKTVEEIFGVSKPRYKVGAMAHLTEAQLGKAVCAEGWAYDLTMRRADVDDLDTWIIEQANTLRAAGYKDFGQNLLFAENGRLDEDVNLVLRIKPHWVTISAVATSEDFKRLPEYVKKIKDAGIFIGILIGSFKHLRLMLRVLPEEIWPDFVILEGCGSGGHNGPCSLLELLATVLPVAKEHGIVVGAAGGIRNAAIVKALFAMGVDFIQIGSPVTISEESTAHSNYKAEVCAATTTLQTGSGRYMHAVRVLPTRGALKLVGHELDGMEVKEFLDMASGTIPAGLLHGDPDGVMLIGEGVGGLKKVRPAADILSEFIITDESGERRR